MNCPRCGHQQTESLAECLACGVILAKAKPRPVRDSSAEPGSQTQTQTQTQAGAQPWFARGAALFLDEDCADSASLVGRAVLLVLLLPWTWTFVKSSVVSNAAGQSWLHLIDLVFHEAGHMLFLPFGAFMTTLGGSLLQLIVPLGLMGVFLFQHRDPFGAAVCWWWAGENLIDLAPYIDDARNLQLVLLGGKTGAEVEGHDWESILTTLGWLHLDHTLGRLAHAAGTIIMLTALAWGALLLLAHWQRSRTAPAE
jgi:hypothetical protein